MPSVIVTRIKTSIVAEGFFSPYESSRNTALGDLAMGLLLKNDLNCMNNCESMKSCRPTQKETQYVTLHSFGRQVAMAMKIHCSQLTLHSLLK